MNGKTKVTWRTLRTVTHSLMVHARVLEAYINFSFMYTADHILLVLPIKEPIKENGKPTTSFKVVTGKKPSVSHLCVFCPFVVHKFTAYIGTTELNMCHQAQTVFAVSSLELISIKRVYYLCTTYRKNVIFI